MKKFEREHKYFIAWDIADTGKSEIFDINQEFFLLSAENSTRTNMLKIIFLIGSIKYYCVIHENDLILV